MLRARCRVHRALEHWTRICATQGQTLPVPAIGKKKKIK